MKALKRRLCVIWYKRFLVLLPNIKAALLEYLFHTFQRYDFITVNDKLLL